MSVAAHPVRWVRPPATLKDVADLRLSQLLAVAGATLDERWTDLRAELERRAELFRPLEEFLAAPVSETFGAFGGKGFG